LLNFLSPAYTGRHYNLINGGRTMKKNMKKMSNTMIVIGFLGATQIALAETTVTKETESTTSGAIVMPPATVEKRATETTTNEDGVVKKKEITKEEHTANGTKKKHEIRKETTEY
jgi:hypothetical protein